MYNTKEMELQETFDAISEKFNKQDKFDIELLSMIKGLASRVIELEKILDSGVDE